MSDLTFKLLRETNVRRSEAAFRTKLADWTPTDWATALAGECGEMCNEIKKMRRIAESPEALAARRHSSQWFEDDYAYSAHIHNAADELADMIIYADLLAARLGIDLAEVVTEKFNEVSDRKSCDIRLPEPEEAY